MNEKSGNSLPVAEPACSNLTDSLDLSAFDRERRPMQYAEWSDRIALGIPVIDEQHKRFFELAASFNGGGDEVHVLSTLVILSDYIRSHLRDEEAMMAAAHYPGLEMHCGLHAHFRQMLADLLRRAHKMSLDEIAEEVKYLINGWFYDHIVTVDFDYAPYLLKGHH